LPGGPEGQTSDDRSSAELSLASPPIISDFSTELSPTHQPVFHNLSTGLSTGCTRSRTGCDEAIQSHKRGPGQRRTAAPRSFPRRDIETSDCFAMSARQNPRATVRLQFFSREREPVNRLTGMIGHFHLPVAARFDLAVHLPDYFTA
jgi:hypothetical protein